MTMKQEKKLDSLINQVVKVISELHELEMTFSRLKNESEELLRKLLTKKMAKIEDHTRDVLCEVDKRISKKLKIAALMVERTARSKGYCPVLTGTARRSILSNWYGAVGSRSFMWPADPKKGIRAGKTEIESQAKKQAIIGSNIEYFPYIELGTSKMAARSPLRRALEANTAEIQRLFNSL